MTNIIFHCGQLFVTNVDKVPRWISSAWQLIYFFFYFLSPVFFFLSFFLHISPFAHTCIYMTEGFRVNAKPHGNDPPLWQSTIHYIQRERERESNRRRIKYIHVSVCVCDDVGICYTYIYIYMVLYGMIDCDAWSAVRACPICHQ